MIDRTLNESRPIKQNTFENIVWFVSSVHKYIAPYILCWPRNPILRTCKFNTSVKTRSLQLIDIIWVRHFPFTPWSVITHFHCIPHCRGNTLLSYSIMHTKSLPSHTPYAQDYYLIYMNYPKWCCARIANTSVCNNRVFVCKDRGQTMCCNNEIGVQ